jgi:hypothetical protein
MRRCLLFALAAIGGLVLAAPAGAHHGSADLAMNMRHVANAPTPPQFEAGPEASDFNSDLAFWGDLAFAGNYNGFRIIDISRPRRPRDVSVVNCRGPQNDVAVWGRDDDEPELLFLGVDAVRGRACAPAPPFDFEGIRIFDVSNPRAPVHITDVDVECGAHTMTLVYDETDKNRTWSTSTCRPRSRAARLARGRDAPGRPTRSGISRSRSSTCRSIDRRTRSPVRIRSTTTPCRRCSTR